MSDALRNLNVYVCKFGFIFLSIFLYGNLGMYLSLNKASWTLKWKHKTILIKGAALREEGMNLEDLWRSPENPRTDKREDSMQAQNQRF